MHQAQDLTTILTRVQLSRLDQSLRDFNSSAQLLKDSQTQRYIMKRIKFLLMLVQELTLSVNPSTLTN